MDSSVDMYNYMGYNNGRASGSFEKRSLEDCDGRISTTEECDSTTGPANPKVQFTVGEDVFYHEETGQNVLGTVALVQGKKVKIIFMDETEKWAHISKVKKLIDDSEDIKPNGVDAFSSPDCQSNDGGGVSSASKKKSKGDINGQGVQRENSPVICGSCGTQKSITVKKAMEYSPFTQHQYNCRKCINKSKTNKNNGVPLPLTAHYLAVARGRPKGSGPDNGTAPLVKGILDQGLPNGVFRQENNVCLHCRSQIGEKSYLHCTMCERPCHSHCLALTPPPLPGDMFWSIICQVCGTQKQDSSLENDAQKIYSSRRSISSWSDVAYLLLSCLGCKYSGERFFDLDEQVIPFWVENLQRLHLPRQYKSAEPAERRKMLLLALKNANLRFESNDRKPNPMWATRDVKDKGLNVIVRPPVVGGGRAVTAAGFPISVRTSNPEAASVAMTNIAQTIAANKANNVPTPKNSPSLVPQKSNSVAKTSGAANVGVLANAGRKVAKPLDHPPVAKKTGSELNSGVQQRTKYNNDIWPQSRYQKTTFLPELPKAATISNNVGQQHAVEEHSVPSNTQQFSNANRLPNVAQSSYKQSTTLSPSPGGAARVSGMVLSSPTSSSGLSAEITSRVNIGSYPVRKTGSPMLNRSIRMEPVERKKEVDANQQQTYRLDEGGRKVDQELIRESPGFNNASQQKISLKRKPSIGKSPESTSSASFSRVLDSQSEAKKLKMSLPNSTDVTSQRVPSPTKPPDSDSPTRGPKKAMSPLQKLSDLQKNGGLTVACLTHTESGVQTVAINPSALEDAKLVNGKECRTIDVVRLSTESYEALHTTPVKNSNGATAANNDGGTPVITLIDTEDHTKEKSNNVTTSPRAFKLASVSSPGTAVKTSPTNERRMARPVRLKRSVVANAQSDKQSKDSNDVTGKSKKGLNVKGNNAAAAALVAKASRGRPKKPFKLQLRRPMGMAFNVNQFNGSVQNGESENAADQTINELDYTWNGSTVNDLLQYGQGYRLECLPKCPESKKELANQAIEYFKEEVTPRPPSYWSSSSNHSKKPTYQKSQKDLKNVDSYYVSGRRIGVDGVQYQVVWRDGFGFEYTSEDEEELGVGLGEENYICFEDYDPDEYFLDKMPVTVNNLTGHCDNNGSGSEHNSDSMDMDEETEGRLCFSDDKANIDSDISGVKREPLDSSAENSPVKVVTPVLISTEARASSDEPVIIDLTDSP